MYAAILGTSTDQIVNAPLTGSTVQRQSCRR